MSDHYAIYLEPSYYLTEGTGFYLKAAYAEVMVESLESIAIGNNSSAYGNETINGTQIGIGMRATHSTGLFTKLEYSQTNYDTVSMTSTTGNKNKITAEPESKQFTIRFGYQF